MSKKDLSNTCFFASIDNRQKEKEVLQGIAVYNKATDNSVCCSVTLKSIGILFVSDLDDNDLPKAKTLDNCISVGFGETQEEALVSLIKQLA